MCDQHLAGGPLVCTSTSTDANHTHTYVASWASDGHTRTEEAAEGRQS